MLLDRSGSMKPNFDARGESGRGIRRRDGPGGQGAHRQLLESHPDRSGRIHLRSRRAAEDSAHRAAGRRADAALERGRTSASTSCCIEQGRRVVLVFTDGVDRPLNFSNRNKSLKDVMKRAEEEDVMVYAIGLAGENGMPTAVGGRRRPRRPRRMAPGGFGGLGGRGVRRLRRPVCETGKAGRRAAEDRGGHRRRLLRADIGRRTWRRRSRASPTNCIISTRSASRPEKLDGKMHDLTVRVTKPQLTVRARKTYLATKARVS